MVIETHSPEETKQIGHSLGQQLLNKQTVIAIKGDLGAGKTTFVQGLAQGLGITEKVLSPTFILMRQHP